jgi:hypothetical protein
LIDDKATQHISSLIIDRSHGQQSGLGRLLAFIFVLDGGSIGRRLGPRVFRNWSENGTFISMFLPISNGDTMVVFMLCWRGMGMENLINMFQTGRNISN